MLLTRYFCCTFNRTKDTIKRCFVLPFPATWIADNNLFYYYFFLYIKRLSSNRQEEWITLVRNEIMNECAAISEQTKRQMCLFFLSIMWNYKLLSRNTYQLLNASFSFLKQDEMAEYTFYLFCNNNIINNQPHHLK
jgi:hypothetical protein